MVPLSMADWSRIPAHLRKPLQNYVEEGRVPGKFLTALLTDKLDKTFQNADLKAWKAVPDILDFVHRYLPRDSYGTGERVAHWEATGGLDGLAVRTHLMKAATRQQQGDRGAR